jgi:hypothetical protein
MEADMIVEVVAPFEPGARELAALYVALNSPVVTLEALPVGPASAAVALHPGPPAGVTLGVRSVRTGQVAFFGVEGELARKPEVALDAVLAYAERLGFLFDDDEVSARGADGRREAARLWGELIGEPAVRDSAAPEPAVAADAPPLDGAVEEALPLPEPELPPVQVLSKFRRAASEAAGAREPRRAGRAQP